jgi:gamma-butyrobetaine hydroxylase
MTATISAHAIEQVTADGPLLAVAWSDGSRSTVHALWLRDNCGCAECRHPGTGERLLDTATLSGEPGIRAVRAVGADLEVDWADGHLSVYTGDWLAADRRPRRRRTLWRAGIAERLPEARHADVAASDAALRHWLAAVDEYGFALLRGAPVETGEVVRVAELFGYVRETNYGRLFDVKAVVSPNNLAYTGLALGPHTDNTYRDPVPTLQLLHCLASSAAGGESTLVDGLAVAEALRTDAPEKLELLAGRPVLWQFADAVSEFEHEAPVIELDLRGEVVGIRYSARAAAPFDLPPDLVGPYYDAYRTFGRMLESPEFQVRFRLDPGDLFIVDNRRVLHGRAGYSGAGTRHLQGCYADVDGLRSRLAVLSR